MAAEEAEEAHAVVSGEAEEAAVEVVVEQPTAAGRTQEVESEHEEGTTGSSTVSE